MDKIQLIKQEIEKRINLLQNGDADPEVMKRVEGVLLAYNSILEFINSLPEEQKPRFPHEKNIVDKVFGAGNLEYFERSEAEQLVSLAKEKLLKDIKITEEHNEDLEESARHYLLNTHVSPLNDILHQADLKVEMQYHKDIENAFKAGAKWQKQKDLQDLFKSDMTMPNKFYEKGKADAIKEMKETLQTEYEKGRFDMREEMMKDAVDATIFSELKSSDGSLFQVKSDRFRMNDVKISDIIKIIPIKTEQQ